MKKTADMKAYRAEYRKNNRERILEQQRQYRLNNPDKVLEQQRAYREGNAEKVAAQQRAYYLKNREKAIARSAAYGTKIRKERMALGLNTMTGEPLRRVKGRIYIMGTGKPYGATKVGFSSDIDIRLADCQVGNPEELKIIFSSDDIEGVNLKERELHREFAHKHIRGEWYRLSRRDIQKIRAKFKA